MTSVISQCLMCQHYEGQHKCAAFDLVPAQIYLNEFDHRNPYPGDNGIQFESVDERQILQPERSST